MTAALEHRKEPLAAIRPVAISVVLLSAGVAAVCVETIAPTIDGSVAPLWNLAQALVGVLIVRLMLRIDDRFSRIPWRSPAVTLVLAFVGCIMAGLVGGVAWPNSGDEYSYVFLADSLRAGRFWHAVPSDFELFRTYHVLAGEGRLFSPYPPGWSAALVPFRVVGALWLAAPLMTLTGGTALLGALRRISPSAKALNPLLAVALLNPFVLFIGGSLFPHSMAFALVAGITWAQLADEEAPRRMRKMLLGVLFGMLLLTRYDVFAFVAVVYAVDRLVFRHWRAAIDGVSVAVGFLPFAGFLLAYNTAITGNPLQLTATWAPASEYPIEMPGTLTEWVASIVLHNVFWVGALVEYGGLPLIMMGMFGLAAKLSQRRLRFYDALFPAAVVFYSLAPWTGGHQYGPRYWLVAFPLASLTIASGLTDNGGRLHLRGYSIELRRFAAATLVFSIVAFGGLMVMTRLYINERRSVFDAVPTEQPAVILLPDRAIKLWPWQNRDMIAQNLDFTRNGINTSGSVLYGRLNVPNAVARACQLGGRAVFEWHLPGTLIRASCP